MAIALGELGRTSESRVKWALKFSLLELSKLSARDRHRAWAMLRVWQGGDPQKEQRPPQDRVLEAQQALRECIEALANRLPDMIFVSEETKWAVWPAQRRRPGARRSGRVTIMPVTGHGTWQPVSPSAVVFAFVNDLNAIEADRLRACPLKIDDEPQCGVVFLAARRQLFCSPRHAQAAAWQRYQPKRKAKEHRS